MVQIISTRQSGVVSASSKVSDVGRVFPWSDVIFLAEQHRRSTAIVNIVDTASDGWNTSGFCDEEEHRRFEDAKSEVCNAILSCDDIEMQFLGDGRWNKSIRRPFYFSLPPPLFYFAQGRHATKIVHSPRIAWIPLAPDETNPSLFNETKNWGNKVHGFIKWTARWVLITRKHTYSYF